MYVECSKCKIIKSKRIGSSNRRLLYRMQIQIMFSIGMGCASFTILWMRIQLEWHAIIFCSIGAFFGMVFGKERMILLKIPSAVSHDLLFK